jgi:effector-binding domain-containing protein
MKQFIIIAGLTIVVLGVVAAFAWSILGSRAEQAQYTVIKADGDIELRDYPAMLVAEVDVSGEREPAINAGFRQLAAYIFGDNTASEKIAMTAPVVQQEGQKIAMTAPVMQQAKGASWTVTFKMPAHFKRSELPRPNNPNIHIRELPGKKFAVIRFSGIASREMIAAHEAQLQDYLKSQSIANLSAPQYAFFNPPYTLPFLRRNEIMIEIPDQKPTTNP